MGSDAIVNARVAAINNKSSNKKRGNKLPKLKPNKVDVRTERGQTQVNKKEHNGKKHKTGEHPSSIPKGRKGSKTTQGVCQSTSARRHEREAVQPITYNNEAVSWTNGSIFRRSDRDGLSKDFNGNRVNSCYGSCSSSCSEDDRCLDDWEAVADALSAEDIRQTSDLEPQASKPEASAGNSRHQGSNRAWSPNDAFRPRSLPSISKQQFNHIRSNSERCFSHGSAVLSWQSVVPPQPQPQQLPSACPICCEDFDVTDSSFEPCPCGFRLCLFCHKKILEVDGRCPGCRKHYASVGDVTVDTIHCTKSTWV